MPKLVQKRLDEGRAVYDLSEDLGRRRLVWADDHASLYAALPDGLMEIRTYFLRRGGHRGCAQDIERGPVCDTGGP